MKFEFDVYQIAGQGRVVIESDSAEEAKAKVVQMAEGREVVMTLPQKKYHVVTVKAEI